MAPSGRKGPRMRDLDTIDSELRLLAAVRRVCREQGGVPSMSLVDALLDERNSATPILSFRSLAEVSDRNPVSEVVRHHGKPLFGIVSKRSDDKLPLTATPPRRIRNWAGDDDNTKPVHIAV
jgi:hypothetical protein